MTSYDEARPGYVKDSKVDVSLAKSLVGYIPQTFIKELLAKVFESYRSNQALS